MNRYALLVVVAVIILGGLIAYNKFRPEKERVSGFIEADEIRLGSRVGGRVAKVLVEEGHEVQQGEVLLELEPYDLLEREQEAERMLAAREAELKRMQRGLRKEEVAQAQARYEQLKAQLELLEAGPREQEVRVAEARLEAAEALLKLAEHTFQRSSTLVESNAIPVEEFDRTKQEYENAAANKVAALNELELLKLGAREEEIRAAQAELSAAREAWELARKGFREEEIEQAEAARDAAQAAVAAVRRQKDELVIKSPVDGAVDSLDLQPGDMVAAGAPVMSIVDRSHLWVRAYVPQNRVGLQLGQELRVTVDSLPNREFLGHVDFISRQAEFTPSNVQTPEERDKQVFRIKVSLEQLEPKMRPGMTADVWLDSAGEHE